MNKRTKERGQALIIVVLAIVGLAGMAGLVIDGGNLFVDRRNAQSAADSAALAAALTRVRGAGGQSLSGAALKVAAQNGYNNDGETNIVEITIRPSMDPIKAMWNMCKLSSPLTLRPTSPEYWAGRN